MQAQYVLYAEEKCVIVVVVVGAPGPHRDPKPQLENSWESAPTGCELELGNEEYTVSENQILIQTGLDTMPVTKGLYEMDFSCLQSC